LNNSFNRPYGTRIVLSHCPTAMNGWAIFMLSLRDAELISWDREPASSTLLQLLLFTCDDASSIAFRLHCAASSLPQAHLKFFSIAFAYFHTQREGDRLSSN
jgi:hypothetical protein